MSGSNLLRVALLFGCFALIGCGGGGKSSSSAAATGTTPPPSGSVSVNFSANTQTVIRGESVTLTWSSTNASSCSASDAWSGNRALSGSETITIANSIQSFTLTCSSGSSQQSAAVSITAGTQVSVTWSAPTTNEDNSTLTDLAGFTVRYGQSSGSYNQIANVNSPTQTTYSVNLVPGDYYFAITAFNTLGIDSALSNEIAVTVN